jgi:tetratricopeptide (TPR) repeat protein
MEIRMSGKTRKNQWLLSAVIAGLPSIAMVSAASAQSQQPTNGRVLDANNRIGSGGTNTYAPPPSVGVFGNQIINGNVTGGRQFRGSVGYSDPNEFRGFAPGRSNDNFIKDSAQVGVPTTPPPISGQSVPYYGASRYASPAQPGFVQNPTAPGYIPAQPITLHASDARIGAQLDATSNAVPRPGELLLPGPVDPTSSRQTILSASSLTGIRQMNTGDANDLAYLARFAGIKQESVLDRLQMDARDLTRMRDELRGGTPLGGNTAAANSAVNTGSGTTAQNLSQTMSAPLEAPASSAIVSKPLNSEVSPVPFSGTMVTQQGTYNQLVGSTPEKQSTQYNELKKRLERYQTDRRSPAEIATANYNATMRARREAEAKATADKNNETPLPPDTKPKMTKDEVKPITVKTMASGINGQGLKDLLTKAEALMREGKFTSAIDQYAAAEQVAPNQPLIWIGRANAELGASYYNRAEGHLKEAFRSDTALLMAQYDLQTFLGQDRLQSVIKDLKEIASVDQKSPTPVFLLGYIAYNTGNERRAAGWLDLAEKRSDGKDPIFKLLREHWSLPTGEEPVAPELNK